MYAIFLLILSGIRWLHGMGLAQHTSTGMGFICPSTLLATLDFRNRFPSGIPKTIWEVHQVLSATCYHGHLFIWLTDPKTIHWAVRYLIFGTYYLHFSKEKGYDGQLNIKGGDEGVLRKKMRV